MKKYAWMLGCLFVCHFTALAQQTVVIESFDSAGQMTFAQMSNAANYRIEWASSAMGPWTNFTGDVGQSLDHIAAVGTNSITVPVPMLYRVVATLAPAGMVLIPGGTNAGTNPLATNEAYNANSYPETYSLTAAPFFMDKYEVTKALWDVVYAWAITNGYSFDNTGSGKAVNHPVHTVNWYDTVKWCNARSQKEGRPAVYMVNEAVYKTGQADNVVQTSAAGYRLPTEVQWEYAARGGVADRRFPWGDSDTIQHARANYWSWNFYSYDTSPTRGYHPTYATGDTPYTSPVGSFAANGYGLHDMAGNVMEWCFDWYPGFEGSYRVYSGSSWNDYAEYCRVGARNASHQGYARSYVGFRAVLPPGQQ